MTQGRLFDAPLTTLCGYCGRPLAPHPTVAGAFACPRCRPLLETRGGEPKPYGTAALAWFAAFVRDAHRDRVR